MAQHWAAKAPAEIGERRWTVPVDDDDGLSSLSPSASNVTIDAYEVQGNDAVLTLSAGSGGDTGVVTVTATTSRGQVLVETFYLPITVSTNALSNTARDVCKFALRRVTGNGEEPEATELSDALERLNDMLATWKTQGADVGAALPLAAGDTIYAPDDFISAIKNNLILDLADLYEFEPSGKVIENAQRGLQRIKTANLSGDREPVDYF